MLTFGMFVAVIGAVAALAYIAVSRLPTPASASSSMTPTEFSTWPNGSPYSHACLRSCATTTGTTKD